MQCVPRACFVRTAVVAERVSLRSCFVPLAALNTFIDDLFAFIIKMPTLHRLSCFRDDLIFLVYLYQRWIYPVDTTRVNEFGQRGDGKSPEDLQREEEEQRRLQQEQPPAAAAASSDKEGGDDDAAQVRDDAVDAAASVTDEVTKDATKEVKEGPVRQRKGHKTEADE